MFSQSESTPCLLYLTIMKNDWNNSITIATFSGTGNLDIYFTFIILSATSQNQMQLTGVLLTYKGANIWQIKFEDLIVHIWSPQF